MSKYIVEVRYDIGWSSMVEEFAVRAKSAQHAKEQYHRYTHENYDDVSREFEDSHFHQIGSASFSHSLLDVRPVDGAELYGLPPIREL